MVALLEKAVELGDLAHEGLLQGSEELGTVSFDGLTGDYEYGAADERVPPTTTTIRGRSQEAVRVGGSRTSTSRSSRATTSSRRPRSSRS